MRKTRFLLPALALLAATAACAGDVTAPQRATAPRYDSGYLGSGNVVDPPPPPSQDNTEVPPDSTGRGGGFIGSGG